MMQLAPEVRFQNAERIVTTIIKITELVDSTQRAGHVTVSKRSATQGKPGALKKQP